MGNFWNAAYLCPHDSINNEIWRRSSAIQKTIQSPDSLKNPDSIGAQQAMIDDRDKKEDNEMILPWVPDLVGKAWNKPEGITIVGSAYAGFISEYSRRPRTMPIQKYKEAIKSHNPHIFQKHFLDDVVKDDSNYYGPIEKLVSSAIDNADLSKISLFDLCRASFVERGKPEQRRDKSGDSIVNKEPKTFDKYIAKNSEWTWRRLREGGKNIIALGYIAEHGLLRLFDKKDLKIRRYRSNNFNLLDNNGKHWVERYANHQYKIGYWIKKNDWWVIEGFINGKAYRFQLLPVYHPAIHSRYDSGYTCSIKVLKMMLSSYMPV